MDDSLTNVYDFEELDMRLASAYFAWYTSDKRDLCDCEEVEDLFEIYKTDIEKLAHEVGHQVSELKWLSWYLERCGECTYEDLTFKIQSQVERTSVVKAFEWYEEDQSDDQSPIINDGRCYAVVIRK